MYSEIYEEYNHKKLNIFINNTLFPPKDYFLWLWKEITKAKEEAALCLLQDRNIFMGDTSVCSYCRVKNKTVDHLATRCDRMLSLDYTRRHNEVFRRIHLQICLAFNFKSSKKIRNHSVQEIIENEKVGIKVDTRINKSVKIRNQTSWCLIRSRKR